MTQTTPPRSRSAELRNASLRLATEHRKNTRLMRSLLGEAVETILVNIAAGGTRRDELKAEWLIAKIEECTRFEDFEPLRGKLQPWFDAWRSGRGPAL